MAMPIRGLPKLVLIGVCHAHFSVSAIGPPSPRTNRSGRAAPVPPGRLLEPLHGLGAPVQLDPGGRCPGLLGGGGGPAPRVAVARDFAAGPVRHSTRLRDAGPPGGQAGPSLAAPLSAAATAAALPDGRGPAPRRLLQTPGPATGPRP